MARLADLLLPVESRAPGPDESPFRYVDLAAVSSKSKSIVKPSVLDWRAAPSRARQRLRGGDVLVSTVRPNLNGVASVPDIFDGAVASTGFCVLRCDESQLHPRYLYHWVQSEPFVKSITRLATGASYPAVSDAIVKSSTIPLPPLPEQRRIASILDEVGALLAAREATVRSFELLVEEDFASRFGNIVENDRGWEMGSVANLVAGFSSGKSIVGADVGGVEGFRVLKISAVTNGSFDAVESKPLPAGYVPPPTHLVREGDLLISRANTADLVGATAMVGDPVHNLALPDKIWRFTWRAGTGVPSTYVWRAFSRPEFRKALTGIATGSGGSMKNISQDAVLRLPLALPPKSIRDEYAQLFSGFGTAMRLRSQHFAKLDELFASLQHRAFRGEL